MSSNFGRLFADTKLDCRSGFDRTLKGIVLSPEIDLESLYVAFETGHRAGDPKMLHRLLGDVISDRDWTWPWMEKCAEYFDIVGLWPSGWTWRGICSPLE